MLPSVKASAADEFTRTPSFTLPFAQSLAVQAQIWQFGLLLLQQQSHRVGHARCLDPFLVACATANENRNPQPSTP